MTEFGPDGIPAIREEQSIVGRVLLGLFLLLAAAGGWIYQFRPQWVANADKLAGASPGEAPAQDEATKADFSALYQKYGMAPLAATTMTNPRVYKNLAKLEKEPCDKQIVVQASLAIQNVQALRGAAELLKGFSDACPEGNGERYRASELFYLLGDYETAIKLSTDLIGHQPDMQRPYFVRAKAEQGLQRYAAAVEDYTTLIRLLPVTREISSEVFTRLSESYDKLGRPCEAIGPIQTYVALDSEKRATPSLLRRISALASKGNCTQAYAKGTARIPRRSNGVSIAKVTINGAEGTFVIDTGASFVAFTRGFAGKAKPQMLKEDGVELQTATARPRRRSRRSIALSWPDCPHRRSPLLSSARASATG